MSGEMRAIPKIRRPRFSLRTLVLFPVIIAAMIAVGFLLIPPTHVSRIAMPLRFEVVDAESLRPIANATVNISDRAEGTRLLSDFDPPTILRQVVETTTSSTGEAELTYTIRASVKHGRLFSTGSVSFVPHWVTVSAIGYKPRHLFLSELTGSSRQVSSATPPTMRFRLDPGSLLTVDRDGIAGRYVGETAVMELSDSLNYRYLEYYSHASWAWWEGAWSVQNRTLSVSPPSPHSSPASPERERLAPRFQLVQWGRRLYLVEDERVAEFRESIRSGDEPRTEARGKFFLREGDWKLSVTGLPAIPRDQESQVQK